ncbi:MAG: prolyl oligopeptidase family serine peptidase, partial [Pseudomonadota bacterium]
LEDWGEGDRTWPAGSVIAVDLQTLDDPTLVLDANQAKWVNSSWPSQFTPDAIYMAVLENGAQSIYRAQRGSDGWALARVLGDGEVITQLVSGDPAGTTVFATLESALSEPTLLQIQDGQVLREARQGRSYFSTDSLKVDRLTATGADGVEIPYWRISDPNRPSDKGQTPPTILYGYGASNSPTLPEYNAEAGRLWINRGGAYVVAQVRGGGEYGPNWYNNGYGDGRDVPLQDFIAIAEDLVERDLASPQSLGLDGTSDGGRLVAGAALLRPDLFAAVVSRDGAVFVEAGIQGGSPILADDLDLLKTRAGRRLADRYWPDRLFDTARGCAPMLLTSWRGDQRVPATQSRALAAKLLEAGCDVLLIEREGGNHATTDAELLASVYGYFADRLGLD